MSTDLSELKQRELASWMRFSDCCQSVLDAAEAIADLRGPIIHAGGNPIEHPRFADAVGGCKLFLDHQAHQAGIQDHQQRKRDIKAAQQNKRTFGLKG